MKPHGFVVYLSPELYVAVVKLQADKGLGRVYPVLYTINEGLYKLGYITKDVYDVYEKKYSDPLVKKEVKPQTIEQIQEQEKLQQLGRLFSQVLKQWPDLREKAKRAHLRKAKEYVDLVPNAKFVLDLANGDHESQGVSNEVSCERKP